MNLTAHIFQLGFFCCRAISSAEDKLGRDLYHLTHKFDEKISEAKRDMRDTVGKTISDAERRLRTMVTEVTGKLQLEMKV